MIGGQPPHPPSFQLFQTIFERLSGKTPIKTKLKHNNDQTWTWFDSAEWILAITVWYIALVEDTGTDTSWWPDTCTGYAEQINISELLDSLHTITLLLTNRADLSNEEKISCLALKNKEKQGSVRYDNWRLIDLHPQWW